jgi:DNA replication protein DnaC
VAVQVTTAGRFSSNYQYWWRPLEYLQRLVEGEVSRREDKSLTQRIRRARFPLTEILDQFQWNWPKKINRPQIQNLFRLNFIEQKSNAIFLGGVGLGKTHLCIALGHAACVRGYTVLFTTAIDIIHTLSAAAATGTLKRAMQRYVKPRLLICDELGYLPIDKLGADLLFQIISERYERGSILMSIMAPTSTGRNLQQRQHPHLSAARSRSAPRRNLRRRRQELQGQGPHPGSLMPAT